MPENAFGSAYFDRYRSMDRRGRELGNRSDMFTYWSGYLKRILPENPRVLEIGCGLGFFSRYMVPFCHYKGIDLSEAAIAEARLRHPETVFETGDATRLSEADASLDAIVIFDVVEHLPDPALFFREAQRVLKPGGWLLITTPNIHSLGNRLKNPASSDFKPGMYTDATHVSLLEPGHWRSLVETHQFRIDRFQTDNLWDIPYSQTIPVVLQRITLAPFNRLVFRFLGSLPWKLGENLVIVAKRFS